MTEREAAIGTGIPRLPRSQIWTGRDGTGRDGTDGMGRNGTGRDGDGTGRDETRCRPVSGGVAASLASSIEISASAAGAAWRGPRRRASGTEHAEGSAPFRVDPGRGNGLSGSPRPLQRECAAATPPHIAQLRAAPVRDAPDAGYRRPPADAPAAAARFYPVAIRLPVGRRGFPAASRTRTNGAGRGRGKLASRRRHCTGCNGRANAYPSFR